MFDADEEPADRYGETWADVYDDEAGGFEPSERQLDLLAGLAGDGRCLELGIGTGRVAVPLAARGVRVEGVDASSAMVERMRSKPGGESIPVAIGDMRDPPVEGPFSLVFVVFNSLFGLPSQRAQVECFVSVAGLLDPEGVFCIECFVPDPGRFDRGHDRGPSLRTLSIDDGTVKINATLHDPLEQRLASTVITLAHDALPAVRPFRLRYAWPCELDLMAQLAGLDLRQRYSNWDKHPFGASSTMHVSIYGRA